MRHPIPHGAKAHPTFSSLKVRCWILNVECWAFALSAFLVLAPSSFAAPPAGYYLVWSDEFNSTSLDLTKWDYWLLGNRRDAVNTASAVSLNGSNLVITTYTSGGTHYTAMVATDGTFRSRYGYWESSIKWSDSNGMWSAFWMQSPTMGAWLSDPQVSGSEIDLAEHRYVDGSGSYIANQVQVNIHWNGYGSAAVSSGSGNVGSGLANGFHAYGFLWTANAYSVLIDGSQVYNGGSAPVSHSTEWAILSSEVDDTSTAWAGYIPSGGYGDQSASAAKLTVDYVRYYAPTNTLFWTGISSAFLTNSANYISNLPPLATSDLTFSYLSGNNLNPALGGDLAVDGLVFLNMKDGASINGADTLTLGAGGIDMVAANHTVNLNCPVNVRANQTWSVGPNSPGNTLILNGGLSGTTTLSKGGYGTLILNGTNSFSGTLNVDTGSTSNNDGALRLTRSANLVGVASPIAIRNNNSGSSTLQLDGSLGNLTVAQNVTLNGRNTNVVAIQNLAGSNTLAGGLSINVGGGLYLLRSDAGTLNLGGTVTSVAGGTRTFTFQGGGDFYVAGAIQNGSAAALNLVKTDSGTLTLAGANPFGGSTTVSGGTVAFAAGGLGTGPVTNAGVLCWLAGNTQDIAAGRTVVAGPGGVFDPNGNFITLSGGISGAGAFAVNGTNGGTLALSGINTFTNSSVLGSAILRATSSQCLGGGLITIGSATTNTCRLELAGNLTLTNAIFPAVRAANPAAHILNVSGTNTLNPPTNITLVAGGNQFSLQSDGGKLVLAKGIQVTGGSGKYIYLNGAGDGAILGSISQASSINSIFGVTKSGAGTWTVTNISTTAATLTVSGGTLALNGTATVIDAIVNSGGTLAGNGTITSSATINPGGTLAPGISGLGTLTFNGDLMLAAGSTNIMELTKTGHTNDVVAVTGVLTNGGTLVVTNLSGALTAGDSFKLFSATGYSGSFAALKLPSLRTGLAWNSDGLTNGILSVVATAPPQFSAITRLSDGNFQFQGTGAAGVTYELDAATNLAPAVIWDLVMSAEANDNGQFQLFDWAATNFPQRFYRIVTDQ